MDRLQKMLKADSSRPFVLLIWLALFEDEFLNFVFKFITSFFSSVPL